MSTKTYFSIGKKGKLAMAILATLSAGFLFPSLARASTSSTEPITGDIKLTDDYSVNLSTGTGNYASKQGYSVLLTPKDDATINIDMSGHDLNLTASSSSLDAYGATITQGGTWNVTNGKGKTITISAEGKDNAYGINMLGTSIDVDANLHIVKAAGTNEAFGIYADMGSKNVFKGDVTIENVALTPDRHDGTCTAGIALWSTGSEDENTSVTVQGKTTIKNSGDAIQIGSKRDVLTLGAASLSINDNSVITDKYHAVTNTFGTVYINIAKDGVTTGTTNIYGDIFNGSTAKTYLALTDADSTWTGSSFARFGKDYAWHGTYLTLQNGATFTNKPLSKDSTTSKSWHGSFLNELTGGTTADKAGNIVMENAGTAPLRIQKISGNTNIFYSHEDSTPAVFSNGNVLIDEASKGANIRVITASNGITTSDTTQVKNVLSALAEKIYYGAKNDTIGDDGKTGNLSGTVEIAEGLTSSSQSLKSTALLFNKEADTSVHYNEAHKRYEPSYHKGYANYEESTKQQNEYTIPITGDSTADALYGTTGVTSDYKNYTFSNNTGKVSIDSGSTPAVNVKNKNVTVDASGLDQINLDSGIYVSGDKGKNVPASNASVTINGKKIQVHHTGSNAVHAYAGGTLALDGTGDLSADSDTVNAEGTIFYTQGSFPNRVNKASITLNGGSITATAGNALSATGSTIRINEDSKGQTLSNDVTIKGDIRESGLTVTSGTTGSAVDIALTTAPSSWTGVSVLDSSSTLNLLLQNGGTWTNEKNSGTDSSFTGSRITTLTGGSAGKAGIIFQNDTNPITVDSYSGNSTVIYKHDAEDPTSITGGNFTIKKADKDSAITLLTDNSGIDMKSTTADARNKVSEVLNKLAQKLFYTGYTDGNLKGTVEIADGLTASSASLKTGDISYSTATTGTKTEGQGYYDYSPAKDYNTGVIKTSENIGETREAAADGSVLVASTRIQSDIGATSSAMYVGKDAADNAITVDLQGHDLKLASMITGVGESDTVYVGAGKTVHVKNSGTAGSLHITAGRPDFSSTSFRDEAGWGNGIEEQAGGHFTADTDVSIEGIGGMAFQKKGIDTAGSMDFNKNLTIRNVAADGMESADELISTKVYKGFNTDSGYGMYVANSKADSVAVNVKGTLDLDNIYGDGIYVENTGKGTATINTAGITAKDIGQYLVQAKGSTVNLNSGTGITPGTVNATGDIAVYDTAGTEVNMNLTDGSAWTGAVLHLNGTTGAKGAVNLTLGKGSTWTNTVSKYNGDDGNSPASALASLKGEGGAIVQGSRAITVDSYSGNSTVIYKHNADDPTSITGGNFTITKADKDSAITLLTDNSGIDMKSTTADARNRVSEVLNKLAQKLFYTGYTDGNLKGTVEIADGLTASSASLKTGDISYSTATTGTKTEGQGYYDYSPAEDIPSEQTDTEFGQQITGDETKDGTYIKAGVLKKGTSPALYKFTKDTTITLAADGTDSDSEKNNGIIRLDGKNADVDATGHTVKLVVPSSTSAGQTPSGIIISGNSNLDFKGNADVSVTGESKAVGVRIPGTSWMDMMNLDVVHGGTAVFENGLTVKAKVKTGYYPSDVEDNQMGLYVGYKNSSITVKGTTDIDVTSASETNAYGVAVADSEATKAGIKDSAVINLNGDTTIKLHTSHNAYALYAKGGQINVNYDGTGAGTAKVNIDGDLYAMAATTDESSYSPSTNYGEINLALAGSSSTWTGVVENASGKHGDVNLWLTDGGMWTSKASGQLNSDYSRAKDYEKYSYLTTLHGGSTTDKAGIIDMTQGTRGISVGNYSGNTLVVYKHEITGDTSRAHADLYGNKAANVIGGSFKITDAAAGSTITLVTDSTGVSTTSTAYTDKNLVNDLLDKLANKLYYSGYANGNLKGYVRIAEGLTSSSITAKLRQEDISFYTADEAKTAGMAEGQGHYTYNIAYPDEQVKDPMATVIDGSSESKDTYRDAGIYKDDTDSYDFTKKPATVNSDGKSDSIIHAGDNDVNVKTNDVLNINAKDGGIGMKAENGKTVTTTGNTSITAKEGTGILADKGTVKLANDTAINGAAGMEAKNGGTITADGKTDITANGNALHADGDGSTIALKDGTISGAVLAENKGTITTSGAALKGDVKAASNGTVALTNGSTSEGITADGGTITTDGTEVAGDALAKANGTVTMTNGKAGTLTADGGTVTTNGTEVAGDALAKENGTVAMTNGKAASVTADGGTASTDGTEVDGLISAKNGGKASMRNGSAKGLSADKDSTVTAELDKADAKLDGDVANEGTASISLSNGASWTGDSTGTGTTTASIGSGSTWTGASSNGNTSVALEGTWKQTGASTVDTLTGKGGTLDKSADGAGETKIANYSGHMSILYSHNESTPTEINGAVTTVGQAADGSSISLITDSKGLSMNSRRVNDRNTVSETFNQLAHKLHYTANDGKLAGRLKIAEGLTSSSAALRTENITFDKDGIGTFVYDPAKNDIAIEYGSDETRMMKGTKSALLGSAMMWRSNNNDIQRRMGDLRLGQGETGVWARYMGGKNKFDQQNTYLNQDYDIGQAGFDKKVGDWTVGFALDHGDGKSHYIGGKGKEKMNTLAIYGTRVSNDGKYFDVIVKTGQVKNKFDVSNEIGNKLHGDYKAWGNSISLEYGKRFVQDSGFYMDPSVEFTAGRLNGKNFKGTSDLGTLYVHQHGFNSAIGRVGFSIGRQLPKSNLYAKFALAHEFAGNFKTDFYADDGGLKSTKVDLGDTWLDMELGGSLSLGKNVYLYGTYTRTFEADMATKWRADVGVRYTF